MKFAGRVVKRLVAPGSKSEREAYCLQTSSGELVLRQYGANAFTDSAFESLEGKQIEAEGILSHNTFIVKEWQELTQPGS
jgi:hypothetical protein